MLFSANELWLQHHVRKKTCVFRCCCFFFSLSLSHFRTGELSAIHAHFIAFFRRLSGNRNDWKQHEHARPSWAVGKILTKYILSHRFWLFIRLPCSLQILSQPHDAVVASPNNRFINVLPHQSTTENEPKNQSNRKNSRANQLNWVEQQRDCPFQFNQWKFIWS